MVEYIFTYYFDPTRSTVYPLNDYGLYWVFPDDVRTHDPRSKADYFYFIDKYYKKGTQVIGSHGKNPSPFEKIN